MGELHRETYTLRITLSKFNCLGTIQKQLSMFKTIYNIDINIDIGFNLAY